MSRKKKERKIVKRYFFSVGRRKRSVALIKLYEGKGEIEINGKPIENYFPGEVLKTFYLKPFELTQTLGKYYAVAKIKGGGKQSQLEAFVFGVSRALSKIEGGRYCFLLKKNGFLTRDPREKERRKPGFAQKARKKKQSPKR